MDEKNEIKAVEMKEFNGEESSKVSEEIKSKNPVLFTNSDEQRCIIPPKASIDKLIDEIGLTWYHFKIYLIFALFFLADGAEMIVISLLISRFKQVWALTETEKGLIGSSVFVGFLLGALTSGKVSDTFGRKPTFVIGAFITLVFASLSAAAPTYWVFIAFRALNGFGIGMAVPSSSSLAVEITPTKYRSWVMNLVWIFFPIGEIFAVIVAKFVLVYDEGWRYLLAIVAIPSLFSCVISFFIYESPKFYLAKKNYDKALLGLSRMVRYSKRAPISLEEASKIKEDNEEYVKNNQLKANFKSLFNTMKMFGLTMKCCLIFFIVSFIYYGMIYILPQAMEHNLEDLNGDKHEMYVGVIISAVSEIPATFMTAYIANVACLGRIRSMGLGFFLTSLAAVLCGFMLDSLTIWASILKFSISIPFGIIYLYVTEAYPTKVRSLAIGVTNSFTRLGGITTPLLSQVFFGIDQRAPFFMYAAIGCLGAFITFILPFETYGRQIN